MGTPEHNLVTRMRATVARHGLFAPGQTVVVGVSGGPDSVALLHALTGLRQEWGLSLVAAHLNHGFRGAEADEDEAYVAAFCAALDVPCQVERADVPARRRRQHLSAQEAARQTRHEFLRRIAAQVGAERIALAHTADDRIETVLLNLLRGTGLEGLGGFPPARLPIVRPFYDARRAETEAYCAAFSLEPRLDSSNAKREYRRNRVRAELLPYLAAYYNERVGDAILRMADLATADNSVLEAFAAEAFARVTRHNAETQVILDATALAALPLALQRRVLRQAVTQVRGHLHDVGQATLEHALEAITQGRKWEVALPVAEVGTVHLRYEGAEVCIERDTPQQTALPWQCELQVPGRTELPRAGGVVEAFLCDGEALAISRMQSADAANSAPDGRALWAAFPLRAVTLPLWARSWQPGDRLRPRGLGGSKKVQDVFTDRKIPAAERLRVPLIVDSGGNGNILWIGGIVLAETALRLNIGENHMTSRENILLLCWYLP